MLGASIDSFETDWRLTGSRIGGSTFGKRSRSSDWIQRFGGPALVTVTKCGARSIKGLLSRRRSIFNHRWRRTDRDLPRDRSGGGACVPLHVPTNGLGCVARSGHGMFPAGDEAFEIGLP